MKEEWRDIPGYEGHYQASSLGNIRSLDRVVKDTRFPNGRRLKGRLMKQTEGPNYFCLSLWKENKRKTWLVHQLVAISFLGPRPANMEVCHGRLGSKINTLDNLRYGTSKDNGQDMIRDGSTTAIKVISSDGTVYNSLQSAAKAINCSVALICLVCKGKVKTAKGVGFKYA